MRSLIVCFLFSFTLLVSGAELPASLKMKNAGNFLWDGISLEYSVIFGNWQTPKIAAAQTTKSENNSVTLVSAADFKGAAGEYKTVVTPLGSNRFKIRFLKPHAFARAVLLGCHRGYVRCR